MPFVRRAIEEQAWDAIVAFGRQAHDALDALDVPHVALPHPTSFAWRRQLLENAVARMKSRRPAKRGS